MFKNSGFDKLLDKATSHLLMEPDWSSIMQICDQIRQDDIQPKYALNSIKKKLLSPNPHSAMFALLVLESVVKNCPSAHEELTSRAYCDVLHEYVKTTTHANVKEKMLELLQVWNSVIARKNPKHSNLKDLVAIMKAEGFSFPAFRESEAMFAADSAPKWVDGEVCHHCRVQFGVMQRKHHCRACGQVFCGQCTQRSAPLPRFGIEKEVRVCDACYEQHTRPYLSIPTTKDGADLLPAEYLKSSLAQQSQQPPPKRSEEELREEEELQLAIALSQSEAEAKEKEKKRIGVAAFKEQQQQQMLSKAFEVEVRDSTPEDPPELSRYLNRSYWENRQSDSNDIKGISVSASAPTQLVNLKDDDDGSVDIPIEDFTNTLRSQVEIFINRMKSNSSRGRSIANDSSVQTLFMNLTTMHSQLLKHIQQLDDKRIYYEGLQDKLTQVKDARAALDALREEHREKLRRQAEEAERLRQLQMAHKLDIMRKKKQEYLQYQRQMALQRVQEQEREMQMRQEQQKQQYMTNPQYGSYIPYPGNPQSIANYYQYGQPSMVMGYPGCAPPPSQHVQIPPPGIQPGVPQSVPNLPGAPQSIPNLPGGPPSIPNVPGAPLQMGQMPMHPHHTASQGMVPQQQQQQQQQPMSLPQFQQQQPGAPPPSPQIGAGGQPGAREEEETQTAELITFD